MRCLLNNKHELRIRVSEANPSPGLGRPVLRLPPASCPRQAIPAAAAGLALLPQSGPVRTAVRWLLRVPPTPGGRSLGGGEANGSGTGRSGMRTLLPVDRPPARPPCWTNCPDTHGGSTRPSGQLSFVGTRAAVCDPTGQDHAARGTPFPQAAVSQAPLVRAAPRPCGARC